MATKGKKPVKKSEASVSEPTPKPTRPKRTKPAPKQDGLATGSATVTGVTATEFPPIAPQEDKPCCADAAPAPTPVIEAAPATEVAPKKMRIKIIVFAHNTFGKASKFLQGGFPRLLVCEDTKTCYFCNPIIDKLGRDDLVFCERNPLADHKTYINYMQKRGYTVNAREPTADELKAMGL